MAVPTVTNVSPTSAPAGTLITLTGTGFDLTVRAVQFGSFRCGSGFRVISSTEMVCYAPVATGSNLDVKVTNADGTNSTSSVKFTPSAYVGSPSGGGSATGAAPTVTGLSPSTDVDLRGLGGTTVTITGTGFTTARQVWFGSEQGRDIVVVSDTSLTVTSPPNQGVVDVTVWNDYGSSANTAADNYTYPTVPTPTITGITSAVGEGDLLVITGTNFQSAVDAGDIVISVAMTGPSSTLVPAVFDVINATTINVIVPRDCATGVVTIYWAGGNVTSSSVTWEGNATARIDTAQTTADGKNTVHYSTSEPSGPGIAGDIWFKIDGTGNCIGMWRHNGSAWVAVSFDAGAIANDAITSAKLAPSLTPPPLLATAPTDFSAYPSGSYYYNTTNNTLYVSNGSSWSVASLTTAVLGKVVTGVIEAGAIGATELAASSVYARNLVVANFDNLVPNPNSELDVSGAVSGAVEAAGVTTAAAFEGSKSRAVVGAASYAGVTVTPLIPCASGDQFYGECMAKLTAASAGWARLWIQFRDKDGGVCTQPSSASVQGTEWTKAFVTFTAPDAAVSATGKPAVGFYVMAMTYNIAGLTAYFDNFYVRRRADANLIVDGTITATKLDVEDVQASVVTAAAINAVNITAANITGGSIAGVTLTGGTIQTDTGEPGHVARVAITSDDVRKISFYSGNEYEAMPGSVGCLPDGTDASVLEIGSPDYGAGASLISLRSDFSGSRTVTITTDTLNAYGYLHVYGNFKADGRLDCGPWVSGVSDDGFWVNDANVSARRWKLYMYDNQLYARYGSGGSEYKIIGP